jgi:hypothetical protein
LERPTNVDYHILAGQDQTTVERIEYNKWVYQTHDDNTLGDSMLPLWTSNLPPFPQWTVSCDHLGILRSPQFQSYLYQILTGNDVSAALLNADGMTVSLNDVTYSPGERISIILLPDRVTERISGELKVDRYDQKSKLFTKWASNNFKYDGLKITNIRATMTAPDKPGAYQVSFNGSHSTDKRPSAIFIVRNT